MAGLVSIPQDYYEAARIDGATGLQKFWRITLPLVRPATVTVIILSPDRRAALLRPDLGDDPRRPRLHLRRDRLGDLQAVPGRLLRPLDRRQRRPVRPRRGRSSCRCRPSSTAGRSSHEAPGRISGSASLAILVSIVVFVVPFIFIVLTAVKDRSEASLRDFSWPTDVAPLGQPRRGDPDPRLHAGHAPSSTRPSSPSASVTLLVVFGAMVGFVLQRRPSRWTRLVNFLVLAGLIIPPAVVPTIWVLQELGLFKTLHGMVLIEVAYGLSFTRAALPRLRRDDPARARRGGDHRRRRAAAAVLPGHPAAAAAGGGDRDRRAVGRDLQRLHQSALLPAGQGERDRAADALQLPEPVQHVLQCCS